MRREIAIQGTFWMLQHSAGVTVENGKVTEAAGSGGLKSRPASGAHLRVTNRERAPSHRGARKGGTGSRNRIAT